MQLYCAFEKSKAVAAHVALEIGFHNPSDVSLCAEMV